MSITVAKFGGTSLASAPQINKVAEIVKSDPARKFVVVSAPGKRHHKDAKVTDLLLALCEGNGRSYAENAEEIRNRFSEIASNLDIKPELVAQDLGNLLEANARKQGRDFILSRGEYICAKIVAAYLGYEFVDAADFVRFDECGAFDAAATKDAWQKLPRANYRRGVVIPGFYGTLPSGKIKTFSRGGSDFTGAVVAAVAEADLYENWTDVSGMLCADPRIVKNPKKIAQLTYSELRELTYMGASVLHDEVVFPLQEAGIPILIKNTNAPQECGTLIVPDSSASQRQSGAILGLAGRKDFTVFTLKKPLMNEELGFIVSAATVFREQGVSIEHTPGSIDALSVVVASEKLRNGKLERIQQGLIEACGTTQVKVDREVALICVVGHNMYHTPGSAADVLVALALAKINTRIINQCVSELNIILGVDNKDYEAAVNAIYQRVILKQ